MKYIKSIITTMLTALIALPASAQTIIGLATTDDFDAIGLISAKEEFPGGTKILENEAASFSLAYDDSWGRNISYSKYGKVYVGSSSEIELGQGAVGNTNPTFVSYQSGVMSAGAVFEINAKMDGWITVFTKLNPNKQYVVFEGKDNPLAYTLGVAGPDYSINYTLPSDKDGYIDFTSPYASRYFIPATKQSTNESGIPLWDVNGEVIASTTKPSDGTAIMEDIPGETKPQFPWMVAGLEVAPAESTGFLTFKVKAGKTYYFSALGSKMVCGGFVFTGSAEEPAVTFAATEELPEVGFKASLPAPEGTSPGTTPVDPFDPSFESGNSTIVLANSEILGDLGLTSAKYEMPGGLMILNSEVGSFGLAYDDEWGTSLDYRTYRDIRVGNSDEFQLDWGVVGNTNPTFVSYQSGVMSAGAVFEIKAKKNGWMTVFTRLNPNKQYVVFEGKTDPCAYTLGVAGSDYTINYSLPSDDNGFINFASPDASRYFITSTLTEVDGNGVASYYKPQAPWDVAGFDQNPEAEIGTGFLTFKVKAGKTYYFSALGSKMVCGGFVFTDTAEEPAVTFCATEELPEVTFETGLVASPGLAAGESFKYEGLWYTVLDPYAKTCKTRDGKEENEIISSGNTFDGNLVIPETVSDGENLYTVTEIGQLGFNRCDNILSVEFPSTLKYIGDHAFRECAGITSIVLPESLDGMGISVFKECPNLKSAYIPNSIKEIKDWTFSMCGSLESVRLPESLEIIRNFAFEFCPITSLNFYASLKEITEYAFMGSEKISSVVYDASMPIQTEDIFTNRVYTNALLTMKNATLADIRATEKWNRFRRVVASDGTEDPGIILLPGDDFEYEGLWYTVLDAEAKTCKTKDGTVDREPGNTVVGDLVIPSSVSDGTTNYKVVEIGFRSFVDCYDVTSVTLPETLETIQEGGFEYCGATSIDFPKSLQVIGHSSFLGSSLNSLNVPDGVKQIGPYAFWSNHNMKSVVLPASLEEIGDCSFDHNVQITSVTYYSENPISCSPDLFAYGDVYSKATLNMPNATLADIQAVEPWSKFEHIIAKDGSIGIGLAVDDDFEYEGVWYTVLDAEAMTCSVKGQVYDSSIGDYTYPNAQCSGELVIPEYALYNDAEYRVVEMGRRSFKGSELTSVTIPESITVIPIAAFEECRSLTTVNLPETITSIEGTAFQVCINLSSIKWPSSLKRIDGAAFNYCHFSSVDLPEGLEELGKWAFQGNPISSVSLPASLKVVEDAPFNSCNWIREVNYAAEIPVGFEDSMFSEDVYNYAKLYTPNAALSDVEATTPWKLFRRIIAKDGSTGLATSGEEFEYDGVWYKVLDAESLTCSVYAPHINGESQIAQDVNTVIPEKVYHDDVEFTVTELREYAFNYVENLVSITLPKTIERIGANALTNCPRLSSLVWEPSYQLDRKVYDAIGNPNLLVYVSDAQFAPEGLDRNVVVDGVCSELILTPGYPFTPVADFTASSSTFTKEFLQTTPVDGCAGWETIVLPFDVTSVFGPDGKAVNPFSTITDVKRQRPYWLYEADASGEWKSASSIQAGVPYIISMPNNPRYNPAYNIHGVVTFLNPNPQRITTEVASPYVTTWQSGREFCSLWLPFDMNHPDDVMGLNVGIDNLKDDEGMLLAPGSAFHTGVLPKPLEAYVVGNDNAVAYKISGFQSAVLMLPEEDGMNITQEGGMLMIQSSTDRVVEIFSADGTLLRKVSVAAGVPTIVDSLPQGVCIIAGRKVMIK